MRQAPNGLERDTSGRFLSRSQTQSRRAARRRARGAERDEAGRFVPNSNPGHNPAPTRGPKGRFRKAPLTKRERQKWERITLALKRKQRRTGTPRTPQAVAYAEIYEQRAKKRRK